jgi:Protein of unknown function (DUF917)
MTRKPHKTTRRPPASARRGTRSTRASRPARHRAKTASVTMIGIADLDDIAVGGAILGTGGGGDPYIGKLMAQQAIRKYGPVRLIDVDEMKDDEWRCPAP